jgi:uncharacterized NAD-dependent epimerase/dehydratase family protein
MHVPAVSSVTVVPETVQTEGVVEAKLTGRLEVAVALSIKEPVESGYEVVAGLNEMVCEETPIAKFTVTGEAAV